MKIYIYAVLLILMIGCNDSTPYKVKVWKSQCNEDYTIVYSLVNNEDIICLYGQKKFKQQLFYYKSIARDVSIDGLKLSFKLDSFMFSKENLRGNTEGATFFKNEYKMQLPSSLDCKIDPKNNSLRANIFMFFSYSSLDTCSFVLSKEEGIPPKK